MALFTQASYRWDPYKNFRFVVSFIDYRAGVSGAETAMVPVAAVSQVSPLKRTTEVIRHRDGADSGTMRKSLGPTDWDPVTLKRGITWDQDFENWANKVFSVQNSRAGYKQPAQMQMVSLQDFRKDVVIDLYNEGGQLQQRYYLYRCWPSEYIALPDLDGNGNAVAIQSLTIQMEGWWWDQTVSETAETALPPKPTGPNTLATEGF